MTMKWLTRAWASGGLDDDEWEAHWRAYRVHCAEVRPRLSGGAERLLDGINLHDANIHSPDGEYEVVFSTLVERREAARPADWSRG